MRKEGGYFLFFCIILLVGGEIVGGYSISSDERLDCSFMDIYTSLYPQYYAKIEEVRLLDFDNMEIKLVGYTASTAETEFIKSYDADFFGKYNYQNNFNVTDHYNKFKTFIKNERPYVFWGSYVSGSDCVYDVDQYPARQLNCSIFPESYFVKVNGEFFHNFNDPQRYTLDISRKEVLDAFAGNITQDAFARNVDFIYMDNILHPSTGGLDGLPIKWENITEFLGKVHSGLAEKNMELKINIAVAPYVLAEDNFKDADKLGQVVDGLSFEMPFHRSIRDKADSIINEARVYRRWLDAGMDVELIAVADDRNATDTQREMLAAMAMMIREPGDKIFVSRGFFVNVPDWAYWPQRFGAAKKPYEIEQGTNKVLVKREFANGKIYVKFIRMNNNKEVLLQLPNASNQEYSIINQPPYSKARVVERNKLVLNPDSKTIGAESFSLGSGYNGEIHTDTVIVSMILDNKLADFINETKLTIVNYTLPKNETLEKNITNETLPIINETLAKIVLKVSDNSSYTENKTIANQNSSNKTQTIFDILEYIDEKNLQIPIIVTGLLALILFFLYLKIR